MISMDTVLKRGYTAWDEEILPVDEFDERIRAVREAMRARDLDALLLINYSMLGAMYEYANIAYLAGLQSGGALVLTPDDPPALITFGGGRELFFTRMQTWLDEVLPGKGDTYRAARDLLAARGITSGAIATVGLGSMPDAARQQLESTFEGYRLEAFDEVLDTLRQSKRPREIMTIGIAKGIADDAAAAAEQVFTNGGTNTQAMIEAERIARRAKARDVRILANMDGGALRPFEGRLAGRHAPLLLWVGVQYQGYWAEAAVTAPRVERSAANETVAAMQAAVRSGARCSDVAVAALSKAPDDRRGALLAYGLGSAIGLSHEDGFRIEPESDQTLPAGALLTLRAVITGTPEASIATTLVAVTEQGARTIEPVRLDLS